MPTFQVGNISFITKTSPYGVLMLITTSFANLTHFRIELIAMSTFGYLMFTFGMGIYESRKVMIGTLSMSAMYFTTSYGYTSLLTMVRS